MRNDVGRVLWLLPVAFIIHDGEELLTMPAWVAAHRRQLDEFSSLNETAANIVRSLPSTTTSAAIAIGIFFFLFVGVTAVAVSRARGFWLYAYACLLGVFSLHALTHVAQAFLFGGYVPGLVGAIVVIPPASFIIYRHLFGAGLLTRKRALLCALLGFGLFGPTALLAQQLGRVLSGG